MNSSARFDDLRPARRRSFALGRQVGVVETRAVADVYDVVAAADEAVRHGHWVAGWVSYEAAPAFDRAMRVRTPATTDLAQLPLAFFSIHDGRGPVAGGQTGPYRVGNWEPAISAQDHAADIRAIRASIRRGDTYQVNTTFRLRAGFTGDPATFYRDLIGAQHGGYGAYIDAGRWVVASASPELFFEWRAGRVVSKPMKGTAARGRDLADDEARRRQLASSEKDRAENIMIVDMVRNDLGRIASTGSVRVPALCDTEKFDTVWQLTSTVTAEPRDGIGLADLFGALFPGASITGAPKVAAMGVIADREIDPRGVYCGAVGFGGPGVGGAPEWVFNVGIRTVLIDRLDSIARYGTGGGVTYYSTSEGEYEEALLKTAVLRRRPTTVTLLETLLWDPVGGFGNLDRHLARLGEAIAYFDVPLAVGAVAARLVEAVGGSTVQQRVRLLVSRDGTVRVETAAAPPALSAVITIAIDTVPVDRNDPLRSFKTTDRRLYEAAAARHPHVDDVVLVNDQGEVTETTVANLAVLVGDRWCTPPLSSGCLPGTRRAALLAEGRIQEAPVSIADLQGADAIVRFNALRAWETCVLKSSGP